jgi:FkbM family methyltransferase
MEDNFRSINKVLEILFANIADVQSIIEVGARDCNETLLFFENYPKAQIFTFECNPATLPICRDKVQGKFRVTLTEKAVSDKNGQINFYSIDPEKTETTWLDGNPGASSLFKASGGYHLEKYVQDKVIVDTTRLDTFLSTNSIKAVDVLWMDIQGAELMALKGLGSSIELVKVIHTEVEFSEIYKGQPLFEDIKEFLLANNFCMAGFSAQSQFSGDAIFLNQSFFSKERLDSVSGILMVKTDFKKENRLFRLLRQIRGKIKGG